MEKEKSNPYTFFILRYRLMNLQGGIFAFEKEKNYGRRKNRKSTEKQKVYNLPIMLPIMLQMIPYKI